MRIDYSSRAPATRVLFVTAFLVVFSGCAPACRMAVEEASSFEKMLFPPDAASPQRFRIEGILKAGFEEGQLVAGPADAPMIYCFRFGPECSRFWDRRFRLSYPKTDFQIEAVITYSGQNGGDCPFGNITIERIIEMKEAGKLEPGDEILAK